MWILMVPFNDGFLKILIRNYKIYYKEKNDDSSQVQIMICLVNVNCACIILVLTCINPILLWFVQIDFTLNST
jgi:hypothetical protein